MVSSLEKRSKNILILLIVSIIMASLRLKFEKACDGPSLQDASGRFSEQASFRRLPSRRRRLFKISFVARNSWQLIIIRRLLLEEFTEQVRRRIS